MKESQVIENLLKIISNRNEMIENETNLNTMGSCSFRAAGKNNCLNMTKSECDIFNGNWSSSKKCSPTPSSGECKAGVQ